jgi:hypothetical protein
MFWADAAGAAEPIPKAPAIEPNSATAAKAVLAFIVNLL